MKQPVLQAPFPWFGGKSTVAEEVWRRFGEVANFVEPFFGSGACLLARPKPIGFETVNDYDGLLSNTWRALQKDPSAVAAHADWPVSECDLHARHSWLIGQRENITARLMGDPHWYDAKAAGWWLWGISSWIGSGWCGGEGPWVVQDGELVDSRQLPRLSAAQGINRQLPNLSEGKGIQLEAYFMALADRLRDVRVACGDFERVLGPSVTTRMGITAIFLDPPYDTAEADCHDAYSTGETGTANRARDWALSHGKNPMLRIALCGYMGEHDDAMRAAGWVAHQWKANGGYGNQGDTRGRVNAKREVIWFSPHCVTQNQGDLFAAQAEPLLHA